MLKKYTLIYKYRIYLKIKTLLFVYVDLILRFVVKQNNIYATHLESFLFLLLLF